jgi:SAM-dependent methyltransferase
VRGVTDARLPETPVDWDAVYLDRDQVWSGDPNGALVAEASDLPPGRALDVGCGEGADAIWLAHRGWQVTALDVTTVALDRARAAAAREGVAVAFVHAGLAEAGLPPRSFDLVSAMYPAVPKADGSPVRVLVDLVAPGGTLLVVHHDLDPDHVPGNGFDPALFVLPADVAAVLGDDWDVEVDAVRDRVVPASGAGVGHVRDVVLRARRR